MAPSRGWTDTRMNGEPTCPMSASAVLPFDLMPLTIFAPGMK